MAKAAATAVKYSTKAEASVTRERKQTVLDRVFDALHKIHGRVTVPLVLDEAAKKTSPIHRYFDWDDAQAAVKWREHQALQMIQASKFVVHLTTEQAPPAATGKGTEVRRLVSAFRGEGFRMRNEAMADSDARAVLRERKLSELRGWCRSVVDFDDLAALRVAIEKLVEKA